MGVECKNCILPRSQSSLSLRKTIFNTWKCADGTFDLMLNELWYLRLHCAYEKKNFPDVAL